MRSQFFGRALLLLAAILLLPLVAFAQGTPADYARARELRARYEAGAADISGPPAAVGSTHRFWYRKMTRGIEQFMLIDADTASFLLTIFPGLAARVATAAGIVLPLLALFWWLDPLRVRLRWAACGAVGQPLSLRRHAGYDHGYHFIQSFVDDHLRHHARALSMGVSANP